MITQNFKNFAKFDLTINKKFYRNMIIMAICIGMGISAFAFLGRWMMYTSAERLVEATGGVLSAQDSAHYANTEVTDVFMSIMTSVLPIIFAGCTFHTLRKKQGRITELTLPATNKEKYWWHVLVSVGGGFCVTLLALLSADLLNFILHLLVYGTEYTCSFTAHMWNIITLNIPEVEMADLIEKSYNGFCAHSFINAIRLLIFTDTLMNICVFIYGNSIKYHYNIIITYAIQVVATLIFMVGFFGFFGIAHREEFTNTTSQAEMNAHFSNVMGDMTICLYVLSALCITISALCIWRSIKRYNNAQITNVNNK